MDPESALVEIFSNSIRNSPVKAIHEPDAEQSPPKAPIKVSRFNLKIFQNYSEKKRAPVDSYDRVQSHSSARSIVDDDFENKFCKKLFTDQVVTNNNRSVSRDLPLRVNNWQNNYDFARDREIQQLNHKIKNLIKEKCELRNKIEIQNNYIQQYRPKINEKKNDDGFEGNFFEVTFKPKENSVLKNKRFPREVFRMPKNKIVN